MNYKGRVQKKIMENSIKGPDPPPVMKKKLFFFLKLDHFLRTFCIKCIFTIVNSKKNLEIFSKNDKTTFRQANFWLRAKFCP